MSSTKSFDEEFASTLDWVNMYRSCGLQAVPAMSPREDSQNYKRPAIAWKEFEDALIPAPTIERWFEPGGPHRGRTNLGLITGRASDGVLCVDLDVKDGSKADAWWHALVETHNSGIEPETPWQRTGGGGRQILFRAPAGWSPPTFKTPIGIDIRGQGGFMVVPPSMHGSGKRYEWAPGAAPHEIEIEEAPDWLIEAIERLREEHGGAPTGQQRERVSAEAVKNSFGMDVDDREQKLQRMVWAAVVDLHRAAPMLPPQSEQDAEKRRLWQQYLTSTKSRLNKADTSNADLLEMEGRGWSELDRKWRYAMKKWDAEVAQAAAKPRPSSAPAAGSDSGPEEGAPPAPTFTFDPWERYVVPPLPVELPPIVQRFVDHQALVLGADRNGIAVAALVACSGALSHDFRLKMMRTGDWHSRPRLWSVLVGDPSDKKTPIINSVTAPLHDRDIKASTEYAKRHAVWQEAVELKTATKRDEPVKPARHVVQDVTVEKLSEILSRTDRGALVQRDELSGWVGSMEQYKGRTGAGSADRSHWIKAYDGGRYTVDRVKGETVLTNFSVSFLAGIQPDRLAELGNLTSDGLLQRFLPVMLGKPKLPVEVDNDQPAKDYAILLGLLAEIQAVRVQCESGAYDVIRAFQAQIHELEQSGAFSKSFTAFLGKLPGVLGSLMLVLHMAEDPIAGREMLVEQRTAQTAQRLMMEFFIPHALEFYRAADDKTDGDTLRAIASYLLTSDLTRFRPKELTANVYALRGMPAWDLQRKLSPLIVGGWLRPEDETPTCKAWLLEDGVRDSFFKRVQSEKTRRNSHRLYLTKLRQGDENEQ